VEAFQPFRPDLKNTYEAAPPVMQTGTHLFNVQFAGRRGGVSRLLAVPGESTLAEVAGAVLKAFKFSDTEHLYEFKYRNRLGKPQTYRHEECIDGPWSYEIQVECLDLPIKGILSFEFDFGASWEFELKLEGIEPQSVGSERIKVIKSNGDPPPQYPQYL
jgi:hypothetical protein